MVTAAGKLSINVLASWQHAKASQSQTLSELPSNFFVLGCFCIHIMLAEWEDQEKTLLILTWKRYSKAVIPSANLLVTPGKQPKLATFVLLTYL